MQSHDALVGKIYDCAANPELWPSTLVALKDWVGASFAMIGLTETDKAIFDISDKSIVRTSSNDVGLTSTLRDSVSSMPGLRSLHDTGIDQAWIQMQACSEVTFKESDFYSKFVAPRGLRDCIKVPFLLRSNKLGIITVARSVEQELFEPLDGSRIAALSPHIRRAVAISDLVDQGRMELALLKNVLGTIPTPIFVIAQGYRVVFANAGAEELLSHKKFFELRDGTLSVSPKGPAQFALMEALDRAAAGDSALGLKGIGIPLVDPDGERGAAYVLPISGGDVRGGLGQGYCGVFVASKGDQLPVTIEILRTVYDLTAAEARTAALVARGDAPVAIAESLGLSINTVRTQIAKSLDKTNVASMTALAGLINSLVPPVTG